MAYLSPSKRRHSDSSFEALIDGEVAYQALLDAIRSAEKYIYISTWNLEPHVGLTRSGSSRVHLDDELLAKARAGVEVKVLVWDGVGQVKLAAERHVPDGVSHLVSIARLRQLEVLKFAERLKKAGSKHGGKSGLRLDINTHLPGGRSFKTGSHHQKLWLMDDGGKDPVAHIGGLNLSDREWDTADHNIDDPRRTPESGLRAYLLRLKADLTSKNPVRVFKAYKEIEAIVIVIVDLFVARFPATLVIRKILLKTLVQLTIREVLSTRPFDTRHDVHSRIKGPVVVEPVDEFGVRWKAAKPGSPSRSLGAKGLKPAKQGKRTIQVEHTAHFRRPGARQGILDAYRYAVLSAKKYIYLENQYFTSMSLADPIARALEKSRNLHLIVVLPNKSEEAVVGPAISRRQLKVIRDLDQAARRRVPSTARVHFLQLAQWNKAAKHYEGVYVHAKVGIIDDKWLTVGSANATERSFEFDTELNVFLKEAKEARAFRMKLWSEHLLVPEADLKNPDRALNLLLRRVAYNAKRTSGPLKGRLTPAKFKEPGGPKYVKDAYDWLIDEFF